MHIFSSFFPPPIDSSCHKRILTLHQYPQRTRHQSNAKHRATKAKSATALLWVTFSRRSPESLTQMPRLVVRAALRTLTPAKPLSRKSPVMWKRHPCRTRGPCNRVRRNCTASARKKRCRILPHRRQRMWSLQSKVKHISAAQACLFRWCPFCNSGGLYSQSFNTQDVRPVVVHMQGFAQVPWDQSRK